MDHVDFNGRVNKDFQVGAKRSKSCLNTTSNEALDSPLKSRSRTSSIESEVYEVVADSENDECENETPSDAEHFTNQNGELNNINVNRNVNENLADDLYDSAEMEEEFVIVEDDGNDAAEEMNNSQEQLSDSKQQSSLDNYNKEKIIEKCPVSRENVQCLEDPSESALEQLPAANSKQSDSNVLLSSEGTDELLKEFEEKPSPVLKKSDEVIDFTNESDTYKGSKNNVNVSKADFPSCVDLNSNSTVGGTKTESFDDTGQDVKISMDNQTAIAEYKVNCESMPKSGDKTSISNTCSTEILDNNSVKVDAQNEAFKSKLLKSPSFSSSEDDNFDLDCMIFNIVEETSPEKKELVVPAPESNLDKVCCNLLESLSSVVQSSESKSSVISDSETNKSDFTIPMTELKPDVNSTISKIENVGSDCVTLFEQKPDVNNSTNKIGNSETDCTTIPELKSNVNNSIIKNDDIESDFITPSQLKPKVNNSINKNEDIESGCVTPSELKLVNNSVNKNDDIESDCAAPFEQKPDVNISINENDIESGCKISSELKPDANNLIKKNDDTESDCITPSELKPDVNSSSDIESGCVTPSELKPYANNSTNKNDDIESDCISPSELKPDTNKNNESDFTNRTSDVVSKNVQCSEANISDFRTSDCTTANISDCDVSSETNISNLDNSSKAISCLDTSDKVYKSDLRKENISESNVSYKSNIVDPDASNEITEIGYFKLNDDKQTHNKLPKEAEDTEDASVVLSNTPTKECYDRNKLLNFPKTIGGIEVDIIEGLIKRGVCVAEDDFHISDSSTTSSDSFTRDFVKCTKEKTKYDELLTKLQTEEKGSRDSCSSLDLLKDSKSTTVKETAESDNNGVDAALQGDDLSEEIQCMEIINSKITSASEAKISVEVPADVEKNFCKDPQSKEIDESVEIKTMETAASCSESEINASDNFIEIKTVETGRLKAVHDSGSTEISEHVTADKLDTTLNLTSQDEKIYKKIKIEENDELEILSDIKSEKMNEAAKIQMKETDESKNVIKCEPLEPNETPEIPDLETDRSTSIIEHCAEEKISISTEPQITEHGKSELVLDPAPKAVDPSLGIEIGRSKAENVTQGLTLPLEILRRESDLTEACSPLEENDKHFVVEMFESDQDFKVLSSSVIGERDETLEKQISESEESETTLSKPTPEESEKALEIKTLESRNSDVVLDFSVSEHENSTEKPVSKTGKSESLVDPVSKGNDRDLSTEVHTSKTGESEDVIGSISEENDNSLEIELVLESKESKVVPDLPSEENNKPSEIKNLGSAEGKPSMGEKDPHSDSDDSREIEILETASAAIHPKLKETKNAILDQDKVTADVATSSFTDVVNVGFDILDNTVKSAISEIKALVSQNNDLNLIDRDVILTLNAIKRKLDGVDNVAEIKKVKTANEKNEEKLSEVNDAEKSKGEGRKRKLDDDDEEEEVEVEEKFIASKDALQKIGDLSFMDMYKKHYKKEEEEAFRLIADMKEQSDRIAEIVEKYTAEVIDFRDSQAELFRKHNFKLELLPKKRTVGVNVKIYKDEDIQAFKQNPTKFFKVDPDENDWSVSVKEEPKTEPKTEYSSPGIKVEKHTMVPKFNLKDTIITPVAASPLAPGKKQFVPRIIPQATRPILNASLLAGRVAAPNVTVSGNRILSMGRPPVVLVPSNQLAASIKSNQCIDLTKEENKLTITTPGVPMPTSVAKVAMPGMPNAPNVLVPLRNRLLLLPSGSKAVNQQFNLPRPTLIPPLPTSILAGTRTVTYFVQQNSGLGARGMRPFIQPPNQQVQFVFRVTNPGSIPTVSPVVNTIARPIVPQQSVSSTLHPSSGLVLISHTSKHPAPFPKSPHYPDTKGKAIPPKPALKGSKNSSGIVLSWNMCLLRNHANISSYQLFAYQETDGPVDSSLWKKVGDVNALPLPMACTLTQFVDKNRYYFTIRAVDVHQRYGPFSDPVSILYEKESDSCTKK